MTAADYGRQDWVDFLLSEPAARKSINARDDYGFSALMRATAAGHANVVSRLVQTEGIHLYYRDCEGRNAM